MFILRQGKLCLYLGSAKYVYSYAGGVLFLACGPRYVSRMLAMVCFVCIDQGTFLFCEPV